MTETTVGWSEEKMFSRGFRESPQSIVIDLPDVDLSRDRRRTRQFIGGRHREDKASPPEVRRSMAQRRCAWRARAFHGEEHKVVLDREPVLN